MATINILDKEINQYLSMLNLRQKQTVLTVVKTFAEESEDKLWQDEIFINKLHSRTSEYESGKIKPLTLAELENRARKSYKSKLAKNK